MQLLANTTSPFVQWLESTRPAPDWPSLYGDDVAGVLSRAGIVLGVIDAAVVTIITRKVTAPVLFDETAVGLRRRRTMAEGMQRLEAIAGRLSTTPDSAPRLDAICAVVAIDYLRFHFAEAPWLPAMPALDSLSMRLHARDSFAQTLPF